MLTILNGVHRNITTIMAKEIKQDAEMQEMVQ